MAFPYTEVFHGLLLAYMDSSVWARLDARYPIAAALVLLVVTAIPMGVVLSLVASFVHSLALPAVGLGVAVLFVVLVLVTKSVDEGDRLLLDAVERILGVPLTWVRRIGRYGVRR